MSYRPKIKTNATGTITDLPLDAETVKGGTLHKTLSASDDTNFSTDKAVADYIDSKGFGQGTVKKVNNTSPDSNGNVTITIPQGTVTSVSAGTGLSISGTSSVNPTVNIDNNYKLPTITEWNDSKTTGYVELSSTSTTLNDVQYAEVLKKYCILKYADNYYFKVSETDSIIMFNRYHFANWTDYFVTGYFCIQVTKSTKKTQYYGWNWNAYTKEKTDTLLTDKQPTLVSGVNIKTINNQSLLGSGNIDIQGGGGETPHLYKHDIYIYFRINNNISSGATFTVFNNVATAYTLETITSSILTNAMLTQIDNDMPIILGPYCWIYKVGNTPYAVLQKYDLNEGCYIETDDFTVISLTDNVSDILQVNGGSGGATLYLHDIQMNFDDGDTVLYAQITTSSITPITTEAQFLTLLDNGPLNVAGYSSLDSGYTIIRIQKTNTQHLYNCQCIDWDGPSPSGVGVRWDNDTVFVDDVIEI